MIIDPHVHIGHDTTFESNRVEFEVMEKMNEVGVDIAIIQPAQFVTFEDYKRGHDRIYDFHLKYPKRVFGMFSMNPHFDEDLYKNEARRCINKLGFVAIKITPLTHILNANVKRARLPFEMAKELGVPIMLHQGLGMPFSLASSYYKLIKEFSDVNVILAHSGTLDNEDECIVLANEFENVYLELSVRTPNINNILRFIDQVGADRIMYASDSPDEMAHIVWVCRNLGLDDNHVEDLLWRTAYKAFNLEEKL